MKLTITIADENGNNLNSFSVESTLDKVNKVVDDVSDKVNSLNGIFSFIDRTTNSFALITDTVINSVTSFIFKIFKGRKKKKEDLEEEDIDE